MIEVSKKTIEEVKKQYDNDINRVAMALLVSRSEIEYLKEKISDLINENIE